MDVGSIFSELELLKNKHRNYKRAQTAIFISYVILFLIEVIFLKVSSREPYVLITIMVIYIMFIENVKKGLKSDEHRIVIKYKNVYKDNFIPLVLEGVYQDVKCSWGNGIDARVIRQLISISNSEPILCKDYLEGKYKGVKFCQSTFKTQIVYISAYEERADYCGRIFVFESKKIVDDVYIYSKSFRNKANALKTLNRVETENVEFNRIFDVSAKKTEEAFYILTPQLMNELLDLSYRYGSMGILYINGMVYVILNQLNYEASDIDIDIYKPLDYFTENSRIKNFYNITNILIEELSLKSYIEDED